MADDDDDDWQNKDRSKKTGRILKGRSGNPRGRPPKAKGEALPFELAEEILKAGAIEFDIVNKKTGRKEKMTGTQAMLKQLVIAGANGDKGAAKQYIAYLNNAARAIEARSQRLYDRLGEYLKSVDDGRPWRLDATEAAFYQRLADQAGMVVTIRAHDETATVEALTREEIEAVLKIADLRGAMGDAIVSVFDHDLATIARRIIYAERRLKLSRGR
jgi:hypothetical protein